MKRVWVTAIVLVITISALALTSCVKERRHTMQEDNYVIREDNELYSDMQWDGIDQKSRRYHLAYIVTDDSEYDTKCKPANDMPLNEMKRFVFQENPQPHRPSFAYVLDTHSQRIYSDDSYNVFMCPWVVDLRQDDIDRLKEKLIAFDVQKWAKKKVNNFLASDSYVIGIEYSDGSIERHFIKGGDPDIEELMNYFKAESDTFQERMLEDRRTSPNIDYLIAYFGWDPSRGKPLTYHPAKTVLLTEPPAIALEDIDRIVVFEAEPPHTVLDHSRSQQKTLFLDVLNGKLYYEPEKAIYEKTYNASVIRGIQAGEAERITELIKNGVVEWKANELYLTDKEEYPYAELCCMDIPAWSIALQYKDGMIVHYSGDGIGKDGWAPDCQELLDALFGAAGF